MKILIKFFFRHNFVVFAGGDAITNMIMTRHPFTLVGFGSGSATLLFMNMSANAGVGPWSEEK